MKKIFAFIMLLALVGSMSFAQTNTGKEKKTDLTAKVPVDKKVRIGHLDNGLTYYIRANKMPENRIQFRMVTNAGSILEDEAQRGLAHFCEHMAFNGIEGLPHNQMIDTLQKNGIEFGRGINAYTSFDETVYYVEMPADNPEMVTMGLTILNGWCGGLLFDPDELEAERGVIHEEWRGNLGAGERLREKTWPTMLNHSKYAERLPIGLESVIMGFKRDDIVRFYKDWYRPDLQAIVIVGDLNVDEMEARVKDIFGKHAKPVNPKARPSFGIPDNNEPLVTIATDKEATSTSILLFWKHRKPAVGTVGDYRQSLLRQITSTMIDERFNELNEKPESPFMSSGAGYSGFIGRENDVFMGNISPKEGRIEEATEKVLTEIYRAVQNGFTQTELDRVKEDILDGYRKSAKEANKTQSNSLADEYTRNYLEGEVIPGIMKEYSYAKEFIPEITLEECNAMIRSWVTENNFTYMLQAPNVKVPTEKDIIDIYNKVRQGSYEPWVDSYKEEPLWTKELPAVKPTVTKKNTSSLDYTEYTCPNGIRFIVKKTELKDDEIRMASYGWGGTSLYEDKDAYSAQMAANLIDAAGIANFSSNDLAKKLKGMTISISPSISDETQGFSGACSPKDLETMLQLLNLYYEAPRKDEGAFKRDVDNLRNQIKFIGENPQVVFLKKFYETAHPTDNRTVLIPTEEQLNSLSLDRVYEIFRERFCDASNQTFFFVGNVSDDDIQMIAKYINNLPANGKQKAETWKDRSFPFATGIQHAEAVKGTDNQGIMLLYGETEGFQNTKKNKMIVQQLSQAMEITALEVIREKMGGTYSPSVQIEYEIMPKGEVSWMFYINCNPEMAGEIEKAALGIINDYLKKGPDAVTLNKVQEQMIINRGTARQNNGFWMGQIQGSYMYNENRDDIDQYDTLVKSVTAKDIKKLAKKFINLKNYVVINLKPEAAPAE